MNKLFIILWMIFFHVVADYNLQGWLASAKQKSFWEQNAPERKYRHDYICALIMHSISWAFMIMIPIAYYYKFSVDWKFALAFVVTVIMHAVIDHQKANEKTINLCEDQLLHMVQIAGVATFLLL